MDIYFKNASVNEKKTQNQQKPNHKKTPKKGWCVYMSVNSLINDSFENTFVLQNHKTESVKLLAAQGSNL